MIINKQTNIDAVDGTKFSLVTPHFKNIMWTILIYALHVKDWELFFLLSVCSPSIWNIQAHTVPVKSLNTPTPSYIQYMYSWVNGFREA